MATGNSTFWGDWLDLIGEYAAGVINVPAGNIVSTNVQDALNELDSKKANSASIAWKADNNTVVHLSGAEDIAWLKTFLNGTFWFRNVLNTITSLFTNVNTAIRTYTFPDISGTVILNTNTIDSLSPTTSAQLASIITNETGSWSLTFATSPTLVTPSIASIKGSVITDTDSATITFDKNLGDYHRVILGGNRTLALSNMVAWDKIVIDLVQDGTGTRTVTWFTTIKWNGWTVPTLTTTINKIDTFGFICTTAGNYQGYIIWQNL